MKKLHRNNQKRLKVALYLRSATTETDPGSQEREMRKKIASLSRQNGVCYQVIQCYSDMGVSGLSWKRPGLQALLDDVKTGSIKAVFVRDFDRLSRSPIDLMKIESIFKKYHCDLVCLSFLGMTSAMKEIVPIQSGLKRCLAKLGRDSNCDLDGLRTQMDSLGLQGMMVIIHSIIWRVQNEGLNVVDGIDELLKFERLYRESAVNHEQ